MRTGTRRGVALTDVLVTTALTLILLAVTLPVLGAVRGDDGVDTSLSNLMTLGVAHHLYAVDNGGRQVTYIVDEISAFGDNAASAFNSYANEMDEFHPPHVLGWGEFNGDPVLFAYSHPPGLTANHTLAQPIAFVPPIRFFGSFRLPNSRPLHDYLNGRFYDPVFYPPNDTVVRPIVEPAFASPWEYVSSLPGIDQSLGDIPAWSGVCLSPAAMFDPAVMARDDPSDPDLNGWTDPWSFDDAFRSPGLFQARYPDLKTHVLEHHWLQNAPADPCNPGFDPGTYGGCEPYYFNHGLASAPATLFYDGSVRLMSSAEVLAADAQAIKETGIGLWSRDTPFGGNGYFGDLSFDGTILGHHVLTTDGILGRDTAARPAALASEPAPTRSTPVSARPAR